MSKFWRSRTPAFAASVSMALSTLLWAAAAPRAPGAEVTLRGSLVCNGACVPEPKETAHDLVLFAVDGTDDVRAEVERIVTDLYPEKGLDADAAQKLMDRFSER